MSMQPEGLTVQDIPRGLSDEVVHQYFFSKGGEMLVFQFYEDSRKAEIVFEDPEVVTKLLSSSHKIGRHLVTLVPLEKFNRPRNHPDIDGVQEIDCGTNVDAPTSQSKGEDVVLLGLREKKNVVFELGEWRALEIANMMQEIEIKAKMNGVDINYSTSEILTTVNISGTMPHIQEISDDFSDLKKHVYASSRTFYFEPYLWGVLKSIRDSISLLEHDYNVSITIAPRSSDDTDSVATKVIMTAILDQCNIVYCVGNPTRHPSATSMICLLVQNVDKEQLYPLIEAGGNKIFTDINCRVKELSICGLPQVFETKAYNLKFEKLVICVVSKWNRNDQSVADVLFDGLKCAMKCVTPPCIVIYQAPSVQVPPVTLLEFIIDGVKNGSVIPSGFTFILSVSNEQDVKDIQQCFIDRHIEFKLNDISANPELFKTSECIRVVNVREIKSDTLSFVSVICGNIIEQKVQVYVNSTNTNLDLSRGALSKLFLKIEGQKLQDRCKEYAPLPEGRVAITSTNNLPCDVIMHVCVPNYKTKGSQRVLREAIQHILKICHQQSLTSIAIPPIGTGKLGYPPNVVANTIISEVLGFNERYPTFLKEVVLVHSDREVYGNFVRVFAERLQQYSTRNKVDNEHGIERNTAVLYMKQCTMEDESVDVIVNPITVGGNISDNPLAQSLSQSASESLLPICSQLIESSIITGHKSFVFTKATGRLRCRKLLHVYNPRKIDDSIDTISNVVQNILRQVEEEKYSSLIIPLFGVGYGLEEKASTIIKACIKFSQSDILHLKKITLIINSHEEYEKVCSYLTNFKEKSGVRSNPTIEESMNSLFLDQRSRLLSKRRSIQPWDAMDIQKLQHKDAIVNVFSCMADHGTMVLNEIDTKISRELVHHIIDDDHIQYLIDSEINDINLFVGSKGVAVTSVNKKNKIHLSGERGLVEVAKTHIEKFLNSLRAARSLLGQFVWHKETSVGREVIEEEISARLEMALIRDVQWLEVHCGDHRAIIDLRNMIELDMNSGEIYSICRLEKPKCAIPTHWEPMPMDNGGEKSCHLFNVPSDSDEFKCAVREFNETMHGRCVIVKLERVQNISEYSKHCAFLDVLKRKYNGDVLMRRLFHGTSSESVEAIAHQGFNRIFAADANAALFGKGVYFAGRANYSAQEKYSVPDKHGNQRMFICQVVIGKYTKGDKTMKVAPPQDAHKNKHFLFDSLVDNVSNPNIYVVMSDSQAYPEYIVTFKHI